MSPDQVPLLYAIADVAALHPIPPDEAICALAHAGVGWIQLRAKAVSDRELWRVVERTVKRLGESTAAECLWINDRPDIAALFPVLGVHLGQDDLPPEAARAVVPAHMLVGRSTHDLAQARVAEADPAVDVVAIGPVFETSGKVDPDPVVGLTALAEIAGVVSKPLVAIGGLDAQNAQSVLDAGADGLAFLGAISHGARAPKDLALRASVLASSFQPTDRS